MKFRGIVFMLVALLCLLAMTQSLPAHAGDITLPAGFTRVGYARGLKQPTAMAFQRNKLFVAEKAGKLRIIKPNGKLRAKAYVKIQVSSDKERGLLGVAIDPHYRQTPFVYVYYTTGPGSKAYSGTPLNRVSRFTTVNGRGTDETILVDNIPSDLGYHNGGDIRFGFDGKLYIAIGDGGQYWGSARTLDNLRGKILRINRDGSVPRDNPFYGQAGKDARIFAFGFRNPFKTALRPSNQTMLVSDVGLAAYEELDWLQAGGDYGWFQYEGPCVWSDDLTTCDTALTDFGTTTPPIHFYSHTTGDEIGLTVIAGVFPTNSNYPAPYHDAFFYGDWSKGWVHLLTLDADNHVTAQYAFDEPGAPVAFAIGHDGNIYLASFFRGVIFKYAYAAP